MSSSTLEFEIYYAKVTLSIYHKNTDGFSISLRSFSSWLEGSVARKHKPYTHLTVLLSKQKLCQTLVPLPQVKRSLFVTAGTSNATFDQLKDYADKAVEVVQTGSLSESVSGMKVTGLKVEEPIPAPTDPTGGVRATNGSGKNIFSPLHCFSPFSPQILSVLKLSIKGCNAML